MHETARWRVWTYTAFVSAASLAERAAKGLLYFAVGSLTAEEFRRRSALEYEHYRARDKDALSGLFWWERDIYDRFLNAGDRILIVGAGTGRDVLALAAAGHEVVGLDCLAGPLSVTQRHLDARGISATLVEGAIEDGVELPGLFDVVIFSDQMYTVIPGSGRRVLALEHARRRLKPGGRIVVTYYATETAERQRGVRLARLASVIMRSDWRLEQHDVVEAHGPKGKVLHYHHLFTRNEFETEVRAAGLRVVYHREPADPPTAVLGVSPA
jgi:SAM-dependent methyltransferase